MKYEQGPLHLDQSVVDQMSVNRIPENNLKRPFLFELLQRRISLFSAHEDPGELKSSDANIDQVRTLLLKVRECMEWDVWSSETSFPSVSESAGYGKALGQCLVTARIAKDYLPDSKIAEVMIKPGEKSVGPHIVLEMEIGAELYYLDLTPDQDFALGALELPNRYALGQDIVHIVKKLSQNKPYQFVRYQSDSDLTEKKSRPLEHILLAKEKLAFLHARQNGDLISGMERYATKSSFEEVKGLDSRIDAIANLMEKYTQSLNGKFEAKVETISNKELEPSCGWLWSASGLLGYTNLVLVDRGYVQEVCFKLPDQIVLIRFAGSPSKQLMMEIGNICDKDIVPLLGDSLVKYFATQVRHLTGPILVGPKHE